MDFIAHGLWGGIVVKTANTKKITKKPISIKWFIFWSIIPDIFAFVIIFVWFLGSILAGYGTFANFAHYQITEPMPSNTHLIMQLTHWLYNFSHSLIVFLAVFAVVFWRKKSTAWVMAGWLLHILIDIPTHSYKFFPTPFLWPLSQWKFDGWSWSSPWFEIFNYLLIIVIYFWLYRRRLKKTNTK